MKYLFIVNPVSGLRNAEQTVVPEIERWFAQNGGDYRIAVTEYPRHAELLARQACEEGGDIRICACGGDGTLSETASGAFGHDNAEIAFYPCGSGNDFIKCFGEADCFRTVEETVRGVAQPMDALSVNQYICFNLMSVGIDADVNAATLRWRKKPVFRGKISYDLALIEMLFKPLGKRLRLTLNGAELNGSYMLVAAGNGQVYGGGYYATPEARPDDGLIDIITVNKISLLRILGVLGKYQRGEHIVNGEVTEELRDCISFVRTDSLSIQSEDEIVVNLDGESFNASSIDVSMLHHSWRFVLPRALAQLS